MNFSFRRIFALVIRHIFILKNPFEFLSTVYWISLDVIIFGFLSLAAKQDPSSFLTPHILLTSIVLWFSVARGAIGSSNTLYRDLSDFNFISTIATPITTIEWMLAQLIMGTLHAAIGVITGFAGIKLLFGYNPLSIGWLIFPTMILLLMFGWIIGMITLSILIWAGKKAHSYIYMFPWFFATVSNAYYPVSVMPIAAQKIATLTPAFYVFNALHDFFANKPDMIVSNLAYSFVLNCIYFALAYALFLTLLTKKKRAGLMRLEVEV